MKNVFNMVVFSAFAAALTLSAPTSTAQASSTQTPPAESAPAPTADEIVSRHLDAVGGKDAISKVKSMSMEMSMQVMGNDAPTTAVVLDGVGYKMETDFNGTKIVQCYTDKGGWDVNPMMGAADPTPMPDDQYLVGKGQIYVGGPLYDYSAKGSKIEMLGQDADNYKIKVTSKEKIESVVVIDAKTYLIKTVTGKAKMQGQEVESTTTLSDYRKTDLGYVIPYHVDIDLGGQFSLSIAVKKVELNKTIDPAIFAMPKPATPAPAAPAIDKPAAAPGPSR